MTLDVREPLRYLGVRGEPDPALYAEISAVADRLTQAVTPRYIWRVFPLAFREEGPALEGTGLVLTGDMARDMLDDCFQAVLLACTLGAGFEAMLRAEQARSMARAAMLDVCGSAWVEAGCDQAEREVSARFPGLYLTDRFSPGYGDLPLELQRDICAMLDAQRRLGVQVTDSLLMNPTKSVTAVIGLSGRPQPARVRGCGFCNLRESCQFRKEGKTCGA
ncbi:MAG: methionine synthase [Clostridiales bacterium]|nr:methionine synthase [Clostridiales bacterium]